MHGVESQLVAIQTDLMGCRYQGEADLLQTLKSDEGVRHRLEPRVAEEHRARLRTSLLSNAVRVDARVLPQLAEALATISARTGMTIPLEAYVHHDSSVNAFVAKGSEQILVVLSSATVNKLTADELNFVIGHELGHVAFGHVDVPVLRPNEPGDLDRRALMQVMAWQRGAEISADRMGLVCCGDVDVAATALFKTLSGLALPDHAITAVEFARQWDHLVRELRDGGETEWWQMTHPFPPLRMKAMILFSEALKRREEDAADDVDDQVGRLLALMDPVARAESGGADPMLADFMLWGSLYVAQADGVLSTAERSLVAELVTLSRLETTLTELPTMDECLHHFDDAAERRRKRLRGMEKSRIIRGILSVATVDGALPEVTDSAVKVIGERLGLKGDACDLLAKQVLEERT